MGVYLLWKPTLASSYKLNDAFVEKTKHHIVRTYLLAEWAEMFAHAEKIVCSSTQSGRSQCRHSYNISDQHTDTSKDAHTPVAEVNVEFCPLHKRLVCINMPN